MLERSVSKLIIIKYIVLK